MLGCLTSLDVVGQEDTSQSQKWQSLGLAVEIHTTDVRQDLVGRRLRLADHIRHLDVRSHRLARLMGDDIAHDRGRQMAGRGHVQPRRSHTMRHG